MNATVSFFHHGCEAAPLVELSQAGTRPNLSMPVSSPSLTAAERSDWPVAARKAPCVLPPSATLSVEGRGACALGWR